MRHLRLKFAKPNVNLRQKNVAAAVEKMTKSLYFFYPILKECRHIEIIFQIFIRALDNSKTHLQI